MPYVPVMNAYESGPDRASIWRQPSVSPVLSLPVRMKADVSSTGAGICIAMVDSDFVQHPDLMLPENRILKYYDAVDDIEHDLPGMAATPRHWHGTMTACTAAGNGYLSQGKFRSLAPDASLVLIRTMDETGHITTDVIVRALQWIADNAETYDIRVVNMSVYADELDHSIDHPVNRHVEELVAEGIVVVAAAGNNPYAPIRPPAAAPGALTIGGLNDKNTLRTDDGELYHSTFGITDTGVQKPELIAPAIWLPGPILPDTTVHREAAALCALDAMDDDMLLACAPRLLPYTKVPVAVWTSRDVTTIRQRIAERLHSELIATPFYKMVDGTSFAAPIVTSVVAQMLSIDPSLRPGDVKDILTSTAALLSDQPTIRQGHGVLQQAEALRAVRSRD